MNLNSKNLHKIDQGLREAFRCAEPEQTFQLIAVLDPEDGQTLAAVERPDPGEFVTREGYREAMIHRREGELAERLGPTLRRLRALGLQVHGGRLGRTAVVKGAASDLLASLDLPAVRQATLDRSIGLPRPDGE